MATKKRKSRRTKSKELIEKKLAKKRVAPEKKLAKKKVAPKKAEMKTKVGGKTAGAPKKQVRAESQSVSTVAFALEGPGARLGQQSGDLQGLSNDWRDSKSACSETRGLRVNGMVLSPGAVNPLPLAKNATFSPVWAR